MNDHKPITGELRAKMCEWGWVERDGSITFTTSPIPTSIDAEQSLAISRSDFERLCDEIDAIHAGLERENAELRAARGDDWIKLPVDADGVPIRVGDMLRYVDEVIECAAITPKRVYFWREHEMHWTPGINCRHYQPPTVEDVLREFALKVAGEECMTMRTGVVEEYAEKLREVLGE